MIPLQNINHEIGSSTQPNNFRPRGRDYSGLRALMLIPVQKSQKLAGCGDGGGISAISRCLRMGIGWLGLKYFRGLFYLYGQLWWMILVAARDFFLVMGFSPSPSRMALYCQPVFVVAVSVLWFLQPW